MKNNMNYAETIKYYDKVNESSIIDIADKMLLGIPVCIDFRSCELDKANQYISFLSGVNYATDGDYCKIKNGIFLFALKTVLKDKSMIDFIKQYTE